MVVLALMACNIGPLSILKMAVYSSMWLKRNLALFRTVMSSIYQATITAVKERSWNIFWHRNWCISFKYFYFQSSSWKKLIKGKFIYLVCFVYWKYTEAALVFHISRRYLEWNNAVLFFDVPRVFHTVPSASSLISDFPEFLKQRPWTQWSGWYIINLRLAGICWILIYSRFMFFFQHAQIFSALGFFLICR